MFAAAFVFILGVAAHDVSVGRTLLVIEGAKVSHFARLQAASVAEVLPVDADGNGLVTAAELGAIADDLAGYVVAHYRLHPVDGDGRGPNLPGRLVSCELVTEDQDALAFTQWIEVELERIAPEPPRRLAVELDLFVETSPLHRDALQGLWAEPRAPGEALTGRRFEAELWAELGGGRPRVVLDSGRRSEGDLFAAGWDRVRATSGAFLALALLAISAGGWRGGLRSVATGAVGLGCGLATAPAVLPWLPALPLAVGLLPLLLGLCLLRRPRVPGGFAAAATAGFVGGLALAAAGSPDESGVALRAVLLLVGGLLGLLALSLLRWPGRAPASTASSPLIRRLAGLAVVAGGWLAWIALSAR